MRKQKLRVERQQCKRDCVNIGRRGLRRCTCAPGSLWVRRVYDEGRKAETTSVSAKILARFASFPYMQLYLLLYHHLPFNTAHNVHCSVYRAYPWACALCTVKFLEPRNLYFLEIILFKDENFLLIKKIILNDYHWNKFDINNCTILRNVKKFFSIFLKHPA